MLRLLRIILLFSSYIRDDTLIYILSILCIFLYTYRHLWWLMITMFGLILAGVLTDYFLFHHVSDRIKELTHVNKELMELKKKHKE